MEFVTSAFATEFTFSVSSEVPSLVIISASHKTDLLFLFRLTPAFAATVAFASMPVSFES